MRSRSRLSLEPAVVAVTGVEFEAAIESPLDAMVGVETDGESEMEMADEGGDGRFPTVVESAMIERVERGRGRGGG